MGYGTAPRKIGGVWKTANGRVLSDAGQKYWSNLHAQGRTDGMGHITSGKQSVPDAFRLPGHHGALTHALTRAVKSIPGAVVHATGVDAVVRDVAHPQQAGRRQSHGLAPSTSRGSSDVARVLPKTTKAAANTAFGPNITAAALGKKPSALGLGVDILADTPIGRAGGLVERGIKAGRAARAAERAVAVEKAGLTGKRALVQGEKAVQITRARSRVTQNVIEKPADVVSKKFPAAPMIGERARVQKAAGRAMHEQQGRSRQEVISAAKRTFPKKGSDEDAAHFYLAQLPAAERNVGGLSKVRSGLQRELDRTLRREPLPVQKKASKSLVAKRARVDRLQKVYDKTLERSQKAVATGKPARSAAVVHGSPTASPLVTHVGAALSNAKDELASAEKRFARPRTPSKAAVAALPQQAQNLSLKIAQLDRIIAKPPAINHEALATAAHFEDEHIKALESAGLLENVDKERRRGLVATWAGIKPTGEEIYVGHRLGKVRGSGGIRSMGFGKQAVPEGVTKSNKLVRLRTGTVNPTLHTTAEDLLAAHKYNDAARARKDLWEMGDPFPGHLPEGYKLVNPEGPVVPADVKTDVLANVADKPQELEAQSHKLLQGFLGGRHNWQQMVDEAKATGTYDKLRIIPEKDANRYYKQFLPAGPRNAVGKTYDKLIDMTAASLIFGRLGYIPKNMLQSMVTIIPHQGVMFPLNAARTAQLLPRKGRSDLDKHLFDFIVHEMGGGTSGSLEKEATSKIIQAPAHYATMLADAPGRISAFIHEAAAHGVIPKLSFYLSDKDKEALLALQKNPSKLHDIRHIATDAMGDFDRLTPAQRRVARRAFIVPGWLVAGSRYPVHFAATHPGRAAALSYVAAGEPGAPKELQVNKPVTDYLKGGLPSYLQAVSAEHMPGFLGGGPGKVERVQSLLPGSIPFDAALAASQGSPWSATGYVNPLPEMIWNTAHSTYETPAGETHKTTFRDALTGNLQRLAPSVTYAQGMIDPSSVSSKLYPDHSRKALTERELGVVPVKIDREAAQRAQYSQRGMTKSIQVHDDQQSFYKELDAAGYEPDPSLKKAYGVLTTRAKRLDAIHAHGLTYQQKAYKSDVAYAVQLGKLSKADAKSYLADLDGATAEEISKARAGMRNEWFGGDVIREAKAELKNASG